jgi:hypothetical protein
MAKRTEACFLVTIGSMSRYFTTFEGGEVSADAEDRYDGGATTPDSVFGRKVWSDITLGSDFDPERDIDDIRAAQELVGDADNFETITVQPCDSRMNPIGGSFGFIGHVKSVSIPSADANSSTTATWSVVCKITGTA